MKILELGLEEGHVAIFCEEGVIDFVMQLSDNFLYDEEEMAFFEIIHPGWPSFIKDQVTKQIATQRARAHQFIQNP